MPSKVVLILTVYYMFWLLMATASTSHFVYFMATSTNCIVHVMVTNAPHIVQRSATNDSHIAVFTSIKLPCGLATLDS